uniref:Uncharacterized protein n=1 Tax=Anguilla anguilla TaxID=7936 RepID=A0A0E9UD28_ANGAN
MCQCALLSVNVSVFFPQCEFVSVLSSV